MMTFDEAQAVLNNGLEARKAYYADFHVREAWEHPESFIFSGFVPHCPRKIYFQVLRVDSDHPLFPALPLLLLPAFSPIHKKKIEDLLARARRIL